MTSDRRGTNGSCTSNPSVLDVEVTRGAVPGRARSYAP